MVFPRCDVAVTCALVSKCVDKGSEDPHQHDQKHYIYFEILNLNDLGNLPLGTKMSQRLWKLVEVIQDYKASFCSLLIINKGFQNISYHNIICLFWSTYIIQDIDRFSI